MRPDELAIQRYTGALPADVEGTVHDLLEATMGSRHRDLAARLATYPRTLVQVATIDGDPAGVKIAYQDRPGVLYSWLGGVHPVHRRLGIGRMLMWDQHAWAREHGFRTITMKTRNQWREMLLLAIEEGFVVSGVEHRPEDGELMIQLRKDLEPPP